MSVPKPGNEAGHDPREGPLDEPMRQRLASLQAEPSPLSAAARERVIAGAVRAGRRQLAVRRLAWGAAAASPLAAAAALWLGVPAPTEPPSPPSVPANPEPARACERWTAVPSAPLALGTQSLGALGVVALAAESEAHIGPTDRCRTELVLERGRVVVQADDLGGGELFVFAGEHAVRVTGTLFAVQRVDGSIEVEVVEGRVRVDESRDVAGGERLVAGEILALDPERARSLRAALAGSEVAPSAETSNEPFEPPEGASEEAFDPDRLARDAERAYRAGDLAGARASFRRAGARSEAALVRWARIELDAGHLDQAQVALDLHRRRHGRASLGAEAQFLRMELADARHDEASARAAAESLLERYPESPQARAARRRLVR